MPHPHLSVIVPLYNCLPLTQAMLRSLRETLPADMTHEIILVDDGSTDGTREWLAGLEAPFRVILNERNLGYGASNNRGAAIARGEAVVEVLPTTGVWFGVTHRDDRTRVVAAISDLVGRGAYPPRLFPTAL